MRKKKFLLICLILSSPFLSCKKYLEAKTNKSLVVPSTIGDFQALLDNTYVNNQQAPSWDETSSDNYYLLQADYNRRAVYEQKAYEWVDYPNTNYPNDWAYVYNSVYYPNVVLDGMANVQEDNQNQSAWDNVVGSALVFRAQAFLRGALLFSKAYDSATAAEDYGIVLRLHSDFNTKSVRASVQDTYQQIIQDLMAAVPLLPVTPQHVMRPSMPAAYGLLARTYLAMRNYDSCYKYADLSLQLKSDLMDYNNPTQVDTTNILFPIPQFNPEVIFSSVISIYNFGNIAPGIARVDSVLYQSYDDNDLRKPVFFLDGSIFGSTGEIFQGTYDGTYRSLFVGVATDEVWLMRAECNARLGNITAALSDLNTLMQKRWRAGYFVPFTATTASDALNLVLTDRRKELIFRGLRWMDIKRLNKEGADITLSRTVNGQTYTLPPNDPRDALLIPSDIINLTGMPQNPR
jgi:starch-binding outer membrane protein, SusD/RagB family